MENNNSKEADKLYNLLAQERTILANERNTLAYIRTKGELNHINTPS